MLIVYSPHQGLLVWTPNLESLHTHHIRTCLVLAVRYDELAPAASKAQRKKMLAVWKMLEEAIEA